MNQCRYGSFSYTLFWMGIERPQKWFAHVPLFSFSFTSNPFFLPVLVRLCLLAELFILFNEIEPCCHRRSWTSHIFWVLLSVTSIWITLHAAIFWYFVVPSLSILLYQIIIWQITGGERLTLTLWFSRDASHDEDAKLVSLLSQRLLHNNVPGPCLPLLASSNMYWFSLDQSSHRQLGFDICWARLHVLGFDVYSYQDTSCDSDLSELLTMPLQLARGVELFNVEFVNILHALQVFFQCFLEVYYFFFVGVNGITNGYWSYFCWLLKGPREFCMMFSLQLILYLMRIDSGFIFMLYFLHGVLVLFYFN